MTFHHLRVVNFGVIREAAIDLQPGLNVVTGETGAGKTLLLGGVRLLMGEKADASAVGPAGEEARAEGLLSGDDGDLAVTRLVPRKGRSRAYFGGVLVAADALVESVGGMVEVVGQHDQIALKRPGQVLAIVDAAGGDQLNAVAADYAAAWRDLKTALTDHDALGGDEMALRRELDLTAFQAGEIKRAGLRPGEDSDLETDASRLRNVEEITAHLAEVVSLLGSMSDDAGEVVARLRKASDLDPSIQAMAGDAEAFAEALVDVARSARQHVEDINSDPEALDAVENRLTAIGDLKRKYGHAIEEILRFGVEAQSRSEEIEGLLARAAAIGDEVAAARQRVESTALRLSGERQRAARILEEGALAHLADLGMESPRLEIRIERIEPGPNGADRAGIWFASDSRIEPGPLGSGASGGELSRLVLAIRLSVPTAAGTTLVFDEVDAGVGGVTALAMGRKLARLAKDQQVLCVTHLPQVAAFADAHFVVSRVGANATARVLTEDERPRELSRMLAGLPESAAGHEAAAELLALARTAG